MKIKKSDIELVRTCMACPEQYDAMLKNNGRRVGYLRLRHGCFTVDCFGEQVYSVFTEGDGMFTHDERDKYLGKAVKAIAKKLTED